MKYNEYLGLDLFDLIMIYKPLKSGQIYLKVILCYCIDSWILLHQSKSCSLIEFKVFQS